MLDTQGWLVNCYQSLLDDVSPLSIPDSSRVTLSIWKGLELAGPKYVGWPNHITTISFDGGFNRLDETQGKIFSSVDIEELSSRSSVLFYFKRGPY